MELWKKFENTRKQDKYFIDPVDLAIEFAEISKSTGKKIKIKDVETYLEAEGQSITKIS